MPKTNAELQAAYRQRHLKAVDGDGARLNMIVSYRAACTLKRLAVHTVASQRAVLEKVLAEAEHRLIEEMTAAEQQAYYDAITQ